MFLKSSAAYLFYVGKSIQTFRGEYFSYYPTKPYVVSTQKNHLIETMLLSTHNIGLVDKMRILEQA